MKEFKNKVALITGAGNGFGFEFTKEAVRRGMKLMLADIDAADLERTKQWVLEQGGTVAVSTVGVMRDEKAKEIWVDGMKEAMTRLQPKQVILYGSEIDFDFGNVKVKRFQARKFGE